MQPNTHLTNGTSRRVPAPREWMMSILALLGVMACTTPRAASPLTRVDGGYTVHLEVNSLDSSKVNGRLMDLVVMDLAPLVNATSSADTAAFVDAVMKEDKYVVKVTGVAQMSSRSVLMIRTDDTLYMDPTHDHALIIDMHDPDNYAQHPNLHGSLGCGSCLLLNQFRLVYTACLTGGHERCPTCITCSAIGR